MLTTGLLIASFAVSVLMAVTHRNWLLDVKSTIDQILFGFFVLMSGYAFFVSSTYIAWMAGYDLDLSAIEAEVMEGIWWLPLATISCALAARKSIFWSLKKLELNR